MTPDIFIEFGPRSILSLLGLITIISGVWYVDRTWDEKGTEAYNLAKAKSKDPNNVVMEDKDLDAAFPFPIAFLIGWILFAASYLFPTNGSTSIAIATPNLIAMGFCLVLGIVASVPMGNAVRYRNAAKKKKLSMLFVLSWVGLTVTSGLSTGNGAVSFICCGLGAVFIIMSMKLLWKFRKMGDSWEQEGRPNPKPIVYNMGGPLFVFGWFLFWVGMSSTNQGLQSIMDNGIPIYFNVRTALAFIAGCGMVPIVMMIDYAHDEGGKYVGYGTDGANFGRLFESPIPFFTFWTLFGLSSFFAVDNSFVTPDLRKGILLANCMIQAVVAGHLIQTALYKGDMATKNKFSMVFVVLFIMLAINISFAGTSIVRYFAIPGAMCVIAGQKTVFGDRKKGDYWMMNNKTDNPNPIVYSAGEPLFMLGWILLSLAISMPM